MLQGTSPRAEENEYLGALTLTSERQGELNISFQVGADGRLTLTATTPTGKEAQVEFSTVEASDEVHAQLLAESPLPGEDAQTTPSGLFRGIKRLFGSR